MPDHQAASRLTVPAVVLGPMGRAYVHRPCGHGRWALAHGKTTFARKCTTCKARWEITFHLESETADLIKVDDHGSMTPYQMGRAAAKADRPTIDLDRLAAALGVARVRRRDDSFEPLDLNLIGTITISGSGIGGVHTFYPQVISSDDLYGHLVNTYAEDGITAGGAVVVQCRGTATFEAGSVGFDYKDPEQAAALTLQRVVTLVKAATDGVAFVT